MKLILFNLSLILLENAYIILLINKNFKLARKERTRRILCQMRIKEVEKSNRELKAELDRRKRFGLDSKIIQPSNNEGWEML